MGALRHCLCECKMKQLLWKTGYQFHKKVKRKLTIHLSNLMPIYLSKRNENISLHKDVHTYVHSSIIYSRNKKSGNNPNIHQAMSRLAECSTSIK